jgi:hypothetical protein
MILTSLPQLSSCGSNDDDGDGGDSKLDARCTSSMRAHYSSRFGMDSTRSSCMDKTHSISDNHK